MPAGIGLIAVAKANDEADAGGFDAKGPVKVKAANAAAEHRINRRKRRGSLRNVVMRKDSDSGSSMAKTAAILQRETEAAPAPPEAFPDAAAPGTDFPERAQSPDDAFGDGFDEQLTDTQADTGAHDDQFESDTEDEEDADGPITVAPATPEVLTDVDDDDTEPEDDVDDDLDGFGGFDGVPPVTVVTVIPGGTTHLEVTYDTDDDE